MTPDRDLDIFIRNGLAAGPSLRPGAVPEVIARVPLTPQQRGWLPRLATGGFGSTVRAAKLGVAGVVVALFGGFLLAGALTQQQGEDAAPAVGASASAEAEVDPTVEATDAARAVHANLLPGVELVTEEVEPGVLRVVSDGIRAIGYESDFHFYDGWDRPSGLAVSPDRNVWIFGPDGIFRLGDDAAEGADQVDHERVDVDADGTVWALTPWHSEQQRPPDLLTFDGENWDLKARNVTDFALHPDGSTFMIRQFQQDPDRYGLIGPVSKDEWQDKREVRSRRGIDVPGGLVIDPSSDGNGKYRFFGWEMSPEGVHIDPTERIGTISDPGYGRDGTRWHVTALERVEVVDDDLRPESSWYLTRVLPGGAKEGESFELPLLGGGTADPNGFSLAVAPDGAVWLSNVHWANDWGVARFDGRTWTWYLPGRSIFDLDFAPNGEVWVQAAGPLELPEDWPSGDGAFEAAGVDVSTYVIVPDTQD